MEPRSPEPSAPIVFAGLLPHAPIAVPGIGHPDALHCRATRRAACALAERLIAAHPVRLFLISPHAPRQRRGFGFASGTHLMGDLGIFGAPQVGVLLPNDRLFARVLRGELGNAGIATWTLPDMPLDHGAVVPLAFLTAAGWRGPTTVASLPARPTARHLKRFGEALARAAERLPGATALIASGDMSHRGRPGAPAGYHPRAPEFDAAFRTAIAEGRLASLGALDPELRAIAAEDVVDPSALIAAALPTDPAGTEVLSYETPFGVGYLVAVLHDSPAAARRSRSSV